MFVLYVSTGLTTVLAKQIRNSLFSFSFMLVSDVVIFLSAAGMVSWQ